MDVDLYGDLDDSLFSSGLEQITVEEVDGPLLAVTNELEEARGKISKLEMQNSALKKNISCLFKTAQLEVQRKDAVIQSLRDKIVAMESSSRHHSASWYRHEDLPRQEPQPFSCNDVEKEAQEQLTCSKENLKGAVFTQQDLLKHNINDGVQTSSKHVTSCERLQGPVRHKNDLPGPTKNNSRQLPHPGPLHSIGEGEARKRSSEHFDTQYCMHKPGGDRRKHNQIETLGYPESKKHCNRENSDPTSSGYQRGHCSGCNDDTARNGCGYYSQNTYHATEDHSQTNHTTKQSRPFKNSLDGYRQCQNKGGSG